MKKISILLAVVALVLASLACQTVMGGGNTPSITVPQVDGVPTVSTAPTDSGGNITVGGDSGFPATSDAFNVVNTSVSLTFQTKLSSDAVTKFYRDEFAKQGYKEDASKAITFGKTFTLAFTGHASGKVIYVVGADAGDGSLYVTITLA